MPIGTSDGKQYADWTMFNIGQFPITSGSEDTNRMPPSDTAEPAGAFKSDLGTTVPKNSNTQVAGDPIPLPNTSTENTSSAEKTALGLLFLVPAAMSSHSSVVGMQGAGEYGNSGSYHVIHAESGNKIGYADLKYDSSAKDVQVKMAYADPEEALGMAKSNTFSKEALTANYNTNKVGPAELSTLGPEIKRIFPEAETVSGYRISGARRQAETTKYIVRPLPTPSPTPTGRIIPLNEWSGPHFGSTVGDLPRHQ